MNLDGHGGSTRDLPWPELYHCSGGLRPGSSTKLSFFQEGEDRCLQKGAGRVADSLTRVLKRISEVERATLFLSIKV